MTPAPASSGRSKLPFLLVSLVLLTTSALTGLAATGTVNSIARKDPNPTLAKTCRWDVVFSRQLNGLSISNFSLVASGGLSGAVITNLASNSGSTRRYIVTATTGTNSGTLGLNMVNDMGVSIDVTNLPFVGEVYTIDRMAPSITAPANVLVECSSPTGQIVALGVPTVIDNFDTTPTVTSNAPARFHLGVTNVIWKATDDVGNFATATQTVTVADTTAPHLSAPPNLTVECASPSGQMVALGSPTVSDACDATPAVTNNAPAKFPLGTTMVTWTATDDSGNTSTAVQSVTVRDTVGPSITAPPSVSVECTGTAGQTVVLGSPVVSDACDATPTVTSNAPATFSLGTTTVTWTATDDSGNSSTATQTVTVKDTVSPSISAPPDVTLECTSPTGQNVALGSPVVSDTCDSTLTVTNDAPVTFGLGATVVTWTATDDSGNSSTAKQTVTVRDTTGPTISAPPDVAVECASSTGQTVALGSPTVHDACDATPTVTNNAPMKFGLGVTVVTWTATDDSGNSSTAMQTVTVRDTVGPSISAPPNLTLECTSSAGQTVALGSPTVHDACDATPTVTNNAPMKFGLGVTVVTWTTTDDSGNSSTAMQTITVRDTVSPTISAPPDVSVECANSAGQPVALGSPMVNDACDAAPTVTSNAPAIFNLGVTVITWTATDHSGNSATATQIVTVKDTIAPSILAPADRTWECAGSAGQTAILGSPTVNDACDAAPIVTNNAPAIFFLGTTIVTWTATDASGNSSTAMQTVTIRDTIAPGLSAPANVTVECASPSGQVVPLGSPVVHDVCDSARVTTNNAPMIFHRGTTVVTWTSTDASGNSSTATQTVTVEDTTPPSISPPPNVTVECAGPAGTTVVLGSPVINDSCDAAPTATNDAPVKFPLGTTVVTWTAHDASGNSATATQMIIVRDTTRPVAPTLNVMVAYGSITLTPPTTSDVCNGTVIGRTTAPLTYTNLGTFTIPWTFDDGNGNAVTVSQLLIVLAQPMLRITSAGPGRVNISWTPDTGGWLLQETRGESPVNWIFSPSGSSNPANLPAPGGERWYRLYRP